ncbi:MAG: zinc ribbon domain-containing protein, partial [Methanoregulaceae archaeon]|nr:zinc ribbon domain-containing protein [Methanoregulaceae archaeon]
MYCPNCGKETEQSGKFCQWCGSTLKEVSDRPFTRRRVGPIKTESFAGLAGRFLGGIVDLIFLILFDILVTGFIAIVAYLAGRPNPVTETIRILNQYYYHLPRTDAAGQVIQAVIPPQIIFAVFLFFILVPWIYFAY